MWVAVGIGLVAAALVSATLWHTPPVPGGPTAASAPAPVLDSPMAASVPAPVLDSPMAASVPAPIPDGPTAESAPAPAPAEPDCRDLGPSEPRAPVPDLPEEHRARGVDASSPAPWRTIRDAGFVFAFAQAAYGIGTNPSFAGNWAMMRRCGLHRAAYHFITPKHDGLAQAKIFWRQIDGDPGELPPIVDVEKPAECRDDCCALKCEPWIVTLRAWLDEIKRAGGRDPIVYTVEPFWNQCLCGTTKFGAHRLWLAGYPKFNFPEKLSSGGWKRWTFYQHAGNVRLGGGVVDLNLFQGTKAELDRWVETGRPP